MKSVEKMMPCDDVGGNEDYHDDVAAVSNNNGDKL